MAAPDSRVINATVDIETIETISEMAESEKRSFSNMVAVILSEAAAKFEQSKKLQNERV